MFHFFLLTLLAQFQGPDNFKEIDKEVSLINRDIKKYKLTEFSDVDLRFTTGNVYSIESLEIRRLAMINISKYVSQNNSMKHFVYFDGEQSELTSEYYTCRGNLIFVNKRMKYYNYPRWHDDFDSLKVQVVENKFYFLNDKMIMWIDKMGVKRKVRDDSFVKAEEVILHDYSLYKNYK